MMKSSITLLVLGVFWLTPVIGQETAADVTEAQVAVYVLGIERGCKDEGRRKGDPTEKVDAFCDCVIQTLKKAISFAEWQQAYLHAVRHESQEEMSIIRPHMQDLSACKRVENPDR